MAIAGAAAAIEDQAHFETTCLAMINSRNRLVESLSALGFTVLPSAANFVFVRHPQHDATQIAAGLRSDGIIVRHFTTPWIAQFLRITVGSDADCQALLNALPKCLQNKGDH